MYTHVDVELVQTSKRAGSVCGDRVEVERTAAYTTVLCCDGLGSGIKANIAATLCASRLLELQRRGYSLREAFQALVQTMNEARGANLPYAAFSLLQVLNNGQATALTYEMPPPIVVYRRTASLFKQHITTIDRAIIGEANCFIEPNEGILLVSDGITQAGLGTGLPEGWGAEGVCDFVCSLLSERTPARRIPKLVHDQARTYWRKLPGDDCTVALALCRQGHVVNIFTGAPLSKSMDGGVTKRFLSMDGAKVVCGATTAQIVARFLGAKLQVAQDATSLIAPPHYYLPGIDLVTEGAVTLNQVFNVFDEDLGQSDEDSGVTRLCALLREADRINIIMGNAPNVAGNDISFRQQRVLPRTTIVPLLREKLEAAGKLVVIESV
ncbi:MAG: SpoIIE family protein phosphatase [Candidatus Hydrogenedentes bacterium]|nr:SpoIIE family protein phosphatase [Candidatus Hydrogenedentota bacterium]